MFFKLYLIYINYKKYPTIFKYIIKPMKDDKKNSYKRIKLVFTLKISK